MLAVLPAHVMHKLVLQVHASSLLKYAHMPAVCAHILGTLLVSKIACHFS